MIWCSFIFVAIISQSVVGIDHPEDFVNLLAGTFTDGNQFSTGNTLPLVGRPWAFNHWAPQTQPGNRNSGSWWFKGSDHEFTWMRCTHQPSPWIGDWGWFLFTPQIGSPDRNPTFFWEPRAAVIKPHLFDATLSPNGIRIELAPTMHGAILRVTFPPVGAPGIFSTTEKRICFAEGDWRSQASSSVPTLTGRATQVRQDRMIITNFALHVRATSESATEIEGHRDMTCFRYKASAEVVTVHIATSLISLQQAEVNLNREVGLSKGFDEVAAEARMDWNQLLRRVDVVDFGPLTESAVRHLTAFYTGLARALSFPRRLDEVTLEGKTVHYSPYDPHGGVFDGPSVTDNGFWDTFRTVYPMLSLLYPDHLGDIIQGWLNAYKEGGWLPSWASPGYRNCMVGTFADVVVADAIVKGVKGFDLNTAREAILKDSFTAPPGLAGGAVGKDGLDEYIQRGFFAGNSGDQVSRTLDFGFADYAVSKALKKLASMISKPSLLVTEEKLLADSRVLAARSKRAQTSLYDKNHGLMAPKDSTGTTSPNFREIEWGFGFVEGNAWHHSFPPYALENLIDLHGSSVKLLSKLHNLLDRPSDFLPGSYNQEIHEMTEARAFGMGQYSHNNQPVHHILYLFALLGDRATTETSVRKVLDRGYGTDFYAGDEDNGEMGAWFVLSALGLFSTVPGDDYLVLGSPIFRHVRIWRGKCSKDGKTSDCDYGDRSTSNRSSADVPRSALTRTAPRVFGFGRARPVRDDEVPKGLVGMTSYTFPSDSSYLHIVALGTAPDVSKVSEITFNGSPLSATDFGSPQLRKNTGPNMATVSGSLLMNSGVLRFVMEGEREGVTGELRAFAPDAAQSQQVIADAETETETGMLSRLRIPGKSGNQIEGDKDAMILTLRSELKQQKATEQQLRKRISLSNSNSSTASKRSAIDSPVAEQYHSVGAAERERERSDSSLQLREIAAVMCLLLLIVLVAVLVVSLFEHLGYVKKKDKKGAHLV